MVSGAITWTAENGPYPTVAGGDGINHYPGGGTNWTGTQWTELSVQSTDTLNPGTIRFGTLVGTFSPTPSAADWFVIGRDRIVTAPSTGAHLYAAVLDCAAGCHTDNFGRYTVTVGGRVHSLRDDFDVTRNPSGPWSYGFRLLTDAPGVFTRFTRSIFPALGSIGGWDGFSQYGDTLPGTNKNFSSTSSVNGGATVWLPNEALSHPGETRDCVVRFRAPVSGVYTLSGSFRGMSVAGTSSIVRIHRGGALLYQTNVNGYQTVVNMPAQQVSLTAGDFIDLAVTKGFSHTSDSTGINFLIQESTCIGGSTGPEDITSCPAGPASFSVTPTGNGPFTYQWQWQPADGAPFVDVVDGMNTDPDGGPIYFTASGARTRTVTVENTGGSGTALSHWDKRCIVTNACGGVASREARLTICAADFNCDSSVDFFDYLDFVAAFADGLVAADFNHDSIVDFFDYLDFVNAFSAGC